MFVHVPRLDAVALLGKVGHGARPLHVVDLHVHHVAGSGLQLAERAQEVQAGLQVGLGHLGADEGFDADGPLDLGRLVVCAQVVEDPDGVRGKRAEPLARGIEAGGMAEDRGVGVENVDQPDRSGPQGGRAEDEMRIPGRTTTRCGSSGGGRSAPCTGTASRRRSSRRKPRPEGPMIPRPNSWNCPPRLHCLATIAQE